MSLFDLFNHKFPYTNFHELNLDWLLAQVKNLVKGLPAGGTTGQILAKKSGTDFDTEWTDPTAGPQGPQGPAGPTGATGPTGPGVVAGGTTGQVLKKRSGTDYDTEWGDPSSYTLPVSTASRLGGVKVGSGLQITEDGILSTVGGGSNSKINPYIVENVTDVYVDVTNGSDTTGDGTALATAYRTVQHAYEVTPGNICIHISVPRSENSTQSLNLITQNLENLSNRFIQIYYIPDTYGTEYHTTLQIDGRLYGWLLLSGDAMVETSAAYVDTMLHNLNIGLSIDHNARLDISSHGYSSVEFNNTVYSEICGELNIVGKGEYAFSVTIDNYPIRLRDSAKVLFNKVKIYNTTVTDYVVFKGLDVPYGQLPAIELKNITGAYTYIVDGEALVYYDTIVTNTTRNHSTYTLA